MLTQRIACSCCGADNSLPLAGCRGCASRRGGAVRRACNSRGRLPANLRQSAASMSPLAVNSRAGLAPQVFGQSLRARCRYLPMALQSFRAASFPCGFPVAEMRARRSSSREGRGSKPHGAITLRRGGLPRAPVLPLGVSLSQSCTRGFTLRCPAWRWGRAVGRFLRLSGEFSHPVGQSRIAIIVLF